MNRLLLINIRVASLINWVVYVICNHHIDSAQLCICFVSAKGIPRVQLISTSVSLECSYEVIVCINLK